MASRSWSETFRTWLPGWSRRSPGAHVVVDSDDPEIRLRVRDSIGQLSAASAPARTRHTNDSHNDDRNARRAESVPIIRNLSPPIGETFEDESESDDDEQFYVNKVKLRITG